MMNIVPRTHVPTIVQVQYSYLKLVQTLTYQGHENEYVIWYCKCIVVCTMQSSFKNHYIVCNHWTQDDSNVTFLLRMYCFEDRILSAGPSRYVSLGCAERNTIWTHREHEFAQVLPWRIEWSELLTADDFQTTDHRTTTKTGRPVWIRSDV